MRYTKTLLSVAALGLFPMAVFAGQSLVLNPNYPQTSSVNDPFLAQNQSWRIEFQMHDWALPAAGDFSQKIFQLDGTGTVVLLFPNGLLSLQDSRDSVTTAQPCFIDITGHPNLLVRFQRDLAQQRVTCEAWNFDGTGYVSQIEQIASTVAAYSANGGILGGAHADLGFLRVFTTVLPLSSKPPTTADAGNWTELKFDGNLNDSSGHGHNASITAPAYVNTPSQVAISFPKTGGTPSWSSWVSLRAGHPAQLDGTASYSLADASSSVTYFWQQTGGPTLVRWTSHTSTTPTITGLIFGTYTFSLRVTDQAGSFATSTLQAGAVAFDDNGVVIPADPHVTQIFGPMIAFGQNPWGFADERAKRAVELQSSFYTTVWPTPTWLINGVGTVSYPYAGIGPVPGKPGTTLTTSLTASGTSIHVADASKLSLASLPTWILIGNSVGTQEMVRIAATTATSGPATLTVAYDGRGLSTNSSHTVQVVPAQAWATGTIVGELRIQGTGTLFASDPQRPLCPAGVPGPLGPVIYSTGTVTLSPGSNVITGNGTVWSVSLGAAQLPAVFQSDNAGNINSTYFIRIAATHAGGLPFAWWALVNAAGSPTQITAGRSLPADVDPGPFPYKITGIEYLSLEFIQPDGATQRTLMAGVGCESETAAFALSSRDNMFDQTTQTGVHYSYKTTVGAQSAFGPNFYGSGMASRAFYFRSGWDFANTTANTMDDTWIRDPEMCGGWGCQGSPLLVGGGIIGAFANVVLNPNAKINWSDLRNWASVGSIGASGCNAFDTRDSGYSGAWLILAGLFDPDPVQRASWNTNLLALNARDNRCRTQGVTSRPAETNSWSNGFLWNPAGAVLTPTVGSTNVTGTSIPSSTCKGVASGTATIAPQATRLTATSGTFLNTGNTIVITGTKSGVRFVGQYEIGYLSPTDVNLAVIWPGDSGNVTWMESALGLLGAGDQLMTIALSNVDLSNLAQNWECIWNSSTSITLNRAWDGAGTGAFYAFRYPLAGYGQQPYMLGIKTTGLAWASALDGALSTDFGSNSVKAATWIHDYGYDPGTQGMAYGRVFQVCEPQTFAPVGSNFATRTPNCNYGRALFGTVSSRELTGETSAALRSYYEANPTAAARDYGDRAYGSLWCSTTLTTGGVYCDSLAAGNNIAQTNLLDSYLVTSKWPGLFFGMGMAHQWPAVRIGGGQPARNRTVYIDFSLGSAASARIVVTAPSGASTTYACGSTAPCAVTVDDRQGSHWFRIQHLSSAGQIVAQSDPDLLSSAP